MKTWNVMVQKSQGFVYLGQVNEATKSQARFAAFLKFGILENDKDPDRLGIYPDDAFEVLLEKASL